MVLLAQQSSDELNLFPIGKDDNVHKVLKFLEQKGAMERWSIRQSAKKGKRIYLFGTFSFLGKRESIVSRASLRSPSRIFWNEIRMRMRMKSWGEERSQELTFLWTRSLKSTPFLFIISSSVVTVQVPVPVNDWYNLLTVNSRILTRAEQSREEREGKRKGEMGREERGVRW